MLDKVFDLYYTTKKDGSGLGLAITQSIINDHGGCLFIESEYNKGTKVNIHLPALNVL